MTLARGGAGLVLVTLLLCITGCSDGAAQEQKKTVRSRISTEYKAPPPSVREMVLEADAVVCGRVVGKRPKDGKGGSRVETVYGFAVQEVLHNFGQPTVDDRKSLYLLRYGGERERSQDRLEVWESRFPQFQNGSEFVLFLRWNEQEQPWEVLWGPAGLIELKQKRGRSWSQSTPLSRFDGVPEADMLHSIRLMKDGGG
jgi:hypothetical protein